LTEQLEMAFREEEIKEGTGKERAGWSFFIIGIIVSLVGYVVYDFHINRYYVTQAGRKVLRSSEYPYQFFGLFLIIIGIVVILIGIGKKVYSRF
jgi:hypothetical protein